MTSMQTDAAGRQASLPRGHTARAGVAAPFATAVATDFFADWIGCQVHLPIYGIALGELCVRDK